MYRFTSSLDGGVAEAAEEAVDFVFVAGGAFGFDDEGVFGGEGLEDGGCEGGGGGFDGVGCTEAITVVADGDDFAGGGVEGEGDLVGAGL